MEEFDLWDFEFVLDETIIERGREYFEDGRVRNVKEIQPGIYEVLVKGTETYTVYIELDGESVVDYDCTCPYDWGPVCKHITAVLYHLQEKQDPVCIKDENGEDEGKQVNLSNSRILDKILESLKTAELKDIIREHCKKDDIFQNRIISKYATDIFPVSKELFAKQIVSVFDSFIGDHGYIPYGQTRELSQALSFIEQNATKEMERENYRNVLYIIMAIQEEVTERLSYVDDSSGHISGLLCFGGDLLTELAEKDLGDEMRIELFEYAIDVLNPEEFQGYDWDYDRAHIALSLMQTPEEKEQLRKALNRMVASPDISEYKKESFERLMFRFITLVDGEDAALHYMECKPENSDFRKELIRIAVSNAEYDKALQLAEEGIKQDEKDAPGLVDGWRRYQLEVYLKTGDRENILRLARSLYFHASRFHNEKDYYQLQKELIPAGDWHEYLEELIEEVKNKHRNSYELLTDIYIRESRWKDFLEQVYNNPSFYRIEHAEKYMAKIYPAELADLYREFIWAALQTTSDRGHYERMCGYIKRMKNLGAHAAAKQLAQDLKKEFPRRKAMIEELNKVIK